MVRRFLAIATILLLLLPLLAACDLGQSQSAGGGETITYWASNQALVSPTTTRSSPKPSRISRLKPASRSSLRSYPGMLSSIGSLQPT